jgi:hypothetical protein
MANKNKTSGRSSNQSSSSSGTLKLSQELHSCSNITALIGSSNGPINDIAEARTWFDKQGWVLSGEKYNRSKLIDILLTVSLLPKLPTDGVTAVQAVAFLMEDKLDDDNSSTLAQATANKFLTLIGNTPDTLTKAKDFFEAISTQQANTMVELHETTMQLVTTNNNVIKITTKLGTITSLLMDDPDPNAQVFQTNNSILRSGWVPATGLPIPVGHNLWVMGHSWVFQPVFIFSCQINIIN